MKLKHFLLLLLNFTSVGHIFSQVKNYELDISSIKSKPVKQLPFHGTNPVSGDHFTVNNLYFVRNNQPWFPIMAEMHYNRVRQEDWDIEMKKIKAAGVSILATYIFWNEHETTKNIWDWKGQRNLRAFVETAARNGLLVWLRIGPWSHGEQLNGGFPEWIEKMNEKRTNNTQYIQEVKKLFEQIGSQTHGLYAKDGGPVIGVQLENEYANGQTEHISKLKELAMSAGIRPIYWTVTANTVFDDKKMEVIPLQGSYPYRGWEKAGGKATKDFLYGNDQWIMGEAFGGKLYYDVSLFPKGLCEQGAGSQMTYENRFVVEPHVIEAHLQNQIGRGMNLVGYYMFHGGTQTKGLKEPGCPENYDFQAPISEFGLLRPSYRYLKILHNFLNDFGSLLAPMQVVEPANPIRNELDSLSLRYIVRTHNNSGFVFLGNTQVRVHMPDKEIQINIKLRNETIKFPSFLLKGQTTPILPFNMTINGTLIKYALAQPFSTIENNGNTILFFQKLSGTIPQLALKIPDGSKLEAKEWTIVKKGSLYQLTGLGSTHILIKDKSGHTTTLIFLERTDAENAWKIKQNGKQVLLITEADVLTNENKIELLSLDPDSLHLKVYPNQIKLSGLPQTDKSTDYSLYSLHAISQPPQVIVSKAVDSTRIKVPSTFPTDYSDIFLNISYLGGSAAIVMDGKTVTDNLYNGCNWVIGLKRFSGKEINIIAKPWENYITGVKEEDSRLAKTKGPIIQEIKIQPQRRFVIELLK